MSKRLELLVGVTSSGAKVVAVRETWRISLASRSRN
jgi:hypothetical protein